MVDGVHNVASLASGPAPLESGDARCSRPVRALRIYSARIARETYGTGERKNLRINESMTSCSLTCCASRCWLRRKPIRTTLATRKQLLASNKCPFRSWIQRCRPSASKNGLASKLVGRRIFAGKSMTAVNKREQRRSRARLSDVRRSRRRYERQAIYRDYDRGSKRQKGDHWQAVGFLWRTRYPW